MDPKKAKRLNRKRKHEAEVETIYIRAQCKNRPFDEKARMEEEELSKDLFGDHSGFLKSLEELELLPYTNSGTDSGVGETEGEDESSNDGCKLKEAWHDEDDDGIDIGSALDVQGRKLPEGGICERSSRYSTYLKHKFNMLMGTPKWAELRKPVEEDDELLQRCGHLVKQDNQSLRPSNIEVKKLKDLNMETYSEGPRITCVEFHPSSTVALVAGISGIASLFAVDGVRNNKLHSVEFKRYPIECARFLQDGMEALLGSKQAHFYSYDLRAAKAINIPLPHGMTTCKKFEVSPCNDIIAVCGRFGQVYLLTTVSKELITTLKQNTHVTALMFNPEGTHLFGHSSTGEVTIWDLRSHRVIHKWQDEGCLQGTTLKMSPSGQLVAAGSAQGVVNVYDTENVFNMKAPRPRKTVFNLTTRIDSLEFNSTSEVLGFSSADLSNAVRLLHVQSGTVFSNFPTLGVKLGCIRRVAFSPNSGYAAFANMNSVVSLYRLKHYKNY